MFLVAATRFMSTPAFSLAKNCLDQPVSFRPSVGHAHDGVTGERLLRSVRGTEHEIRRKGKLGKCLHASESVSRHTHHVGPWVLVSSQRSHKQAGRCRDVFHGCIVESLESRVWSVADASFSCSMHDGWGLSMFKCGASLSKYEAHRPVELTEEPARLDLRLFRSRITGLRGPICRVEKTGRRRTTSPVGLTSTVKGSPGSRNRKRGFWPRPARSDSEQVWITFW